MSDDEQQSEINNDNSTNEFRNNTFKKRYDKRNDISESELIRRRKQGTKKRQEKLIDTLERKKLKPCTDNKPDQKLETKNKFKTVFEAQEGEKQNQRNGETIGRVPH